MGAAVHARRRLGLAGRHALADRQRRCRGMKQQSTTNRQPTTDTEQPALAGGAAGN